MTMPISLLIPAAGRGSRFSSVGIEIPKPLIPILEIPMLLWVIANFPLRVKDKVLVLSQASHQLPAHVGDFLKKVEFDIDFVEIDFLTDGPAHSLEILLGEVASDTPVICANSDQYVFNGLESFSDAVRLGHSEGQILTMEASSNAWSYVGRDECGRVNRVVEKEEISQEATVGVYGWANSNICREALVWQRFKGQKVNNEFYVAPSYHYLIENGLEISTHSVGSHGEGVHGLGTPTDLEHFLQLDKVQDEHKRCIDKLGL
jgi:NDP-sugar pyrophosphorylase family protein